MNKKTFEKRARADKNFAKATSGLSDTDVDRVITLACTLKSIGGVEGAIEKWQGIKSSVSKGKKFDLTFVGIDEKGNETRTECDASEFITEISKGMRLVEIATAISKTVR